MALAIAAPRGRADHHPAPAHALLGAILEASAAEVGWLAWLDRPDPLVLGASSPIDSTDIAEFPEPPAQPLVSAVLHPSTYSQSARAVGDSIDASYCLIAIQDSKGALTLRAAAGQRAPRRMGVSSWPLRDLRACSRALRERHAVVLNFHRHDPAIAGERRALFSPTTQVGVIVPFFAGARTRGVLIIGEERRSRRQPLSPERIAILELVASRIAHILRISRRLEHERVAEP